MVHRRIARRSLSAVRTSRPVLCPHLVLYLFPALCLLPIPRP